MTDPGALLILGVALNPFLYITVAWAILGRREKRRAPAARAEARTVQPEPIISPWVRRALGGSLPVSSGAPLVRWPADKR